ncbi:hypothetical protein SEUBUCD646_0O02480 [Saccharomyces eubayanus]|nr:hypothetical protein SEUBUCD646_0O02480 [Saccharomyces eubayanus]
MSYLETQLTKRQEQIKEYQEMNSSLTKTFELISAEKEINETPKEISSKYIKELKEYNELRDAGLRLAQIIADEKQCKIKDIFEEIGYSLKD